MAAIGSTTPTRLKSTASVGHFLHQVLRESCSTPSHGSPLKSSSFQTRLFLLATECFHGFASFFSLPEAESVGFQTLLASSVPNRLGDKEVLKILVLEKRLNGRKPEAQAWDALQGTVVCYEHSTPAHTSQRGSHHSHLQGLWRQPMIQKGHGHAFWLFLSPAVEPWEGKVTTRSLNRNHTYVPDYVQSRQNHMLPRSRWG